MRRRRLVDRVADLRHAPFEAALAFAAAVASIVGLLNPDPLQQAAIGHGAREWLPAWEALYAAGGIVVLAGLLAYSVRVEVIGLCLFVAAVTVNGIAVVNFSGQRGLLAFTTYFAIGVAGLGRMHLLIAGYRRVRSGQ